MAEITRDFGNGVLNNYQAVKVEHPHTTFGAVMNGFASYMRDNVFPRANSVVMSTYSKTIQRYKNRQSTTGENWSQKFPFLVIDPMFDFEPDPIAGRFLHSFHNWRWKFAAKLFGPVVYNDDWFELHPVFNRYSGTMEAVLWCSSVSELVDMRFDIFQRFGGTGRIIYPKWIECLAVLPDSIRTEYVEDPENGEKHFMLLDDNPMIEEILIKSIAQPKYTVPLYLDPWFKLTGVSDGSDKYGGSGDAISDHRMTVSIDWECNIPTHFILIKKGFPEPIKKIEMINRLTAFYFSSNEIPGVFIGDEMTSVSYVKGDDESRILDLVYDRKSNYMVTAEDAEKVAAGLDFQVPMTQPCDVRRLKAYGKHGEFDDAYHFSVDEENSTVTFHGRLLGNLVEGDVIMLVYYKDMVFRD